MKVRFQADADFNRHITEGIAALKGREPTVSFQTAHEAGTQRSCQARLFMTER